LFIFILISAGYEFVAKENPDGMKLAFITDKS